MMRPSAVLKGQQILRTSTRRRITTASPSVLSPLSSACLSCRLKLQQDSSKRHFQRRYQSASSSPSPSTQANKSNPTNSQPPRTHYDLFPKTLPDGSPPSGPFVIDIRALRREFIQLQAIAHPDRHSGADKARAEGTSALINEAYKTLQNPLLRAQYLLSLRGIDVAEDETAKVEDPELLMEVLETREEIEGAEEEGELKGLREVNEGRIEECEGRLDRAFREDDLEGAKREVVRLRYWVNIREALDGWERGRPIVLVH